MDEYPKMISTHGPDIDGNDTAFRIVVDSEEQENACASGSAIFKQTKTAQGDHWAIIGYHTPPEAPETSKSKKGK